jgi:hypothetical protein
MLSPRIKIFDAAAPVARVESRNLDAIFFLTVFHSEDFGACPPNVCTSSFKGDEERKSEKGDEKHVRNQSVKLFVAVLVIDYYNTQFVFPQCEKLSSV